LNKIFSTGLLVDTGGSRSAKLRARERMIVNEGEMEVKRGYLVTNTVSNENHYDPSKQQGGGRYPELFSISGHWKMERLSRCSDMHGVSFMI
jgi:hypothetical protein